MRLPLSAAFVATVLTAAVIFLLRAFPFLLFSKKDPPPFLRFIEKYIPSMIMAVLIVYCLKDVRVTVAPFGIASFVGIAVTAVLHLWRNNAMISIFGGTVVYMLLRLL